MITPTIAHHRVQASVQTSSDPLKMYAADICTVTVNIAGLPGISAFPAASALTAMPIGMQLIGPKFSEAYSAAYCGQLMRQISGGFCGRTGAS